MTNPLLLTHNWIFRNQKGEVLMRVIATGNEKQEAGESILAILEKEFGCKLTVKLDKIETPKELLTNKR
jgi:hypothetical protein